MREILTGRPTNHEAHEGAQYSPMWVVVFFVPW